jgi:hypothetical protein
MNTGGIWQEIRVQVVEGHRVASGLNLNPRFPGGTLRMQALYFLDRGLDITCFHLATINVRIAPWVYRVVQARYTFRQLKWHPTEPAEDFSFFDFRWRLDVLGYLPGLIYFPHPETKPEHFQPSDMLELLLPRVIPGITYGMNATIEVPSDQLCLELPSTDSLT